MFSVLAGVITRIVSNSYLNVFQKLLTSKGAKSSVVNFNTYFGLVVISLFPLIIGKNFASSVIFNEIILNSFIMGLLGALGNYFIIKALSLGELSSLAPINSYKPIVAMVIAFFYLGETPTPLACLGIGLIIFGTYFIFNIKSCINKTALLYRILALIFSGSEAVFIKKIIVLTNLPTSFFLWAFSGLIFSLIFVMIGKYRIKIPPCKEQYLLILSVGVMQYSTNYVFENMNVSYALALFQLSTLLSVFLGANIFNEKEFAKKIIASIIMTLGAIVIVLS